MLPQVAEERHGTPIVSVLKSALLQAVQRDLEADGSRLRRMMMGKWRDSNRRSLLRSLAEALNEGASSTEIASLISTSGRGNDIAFTYTKPDGTSTVRHVSVQGVSGASLRGATTMMERSRAFASTESPMQGLCKAAERATKPTAEADRGRPPGFPGFNVLAGGPGSFYSFPNSRSGTPSAKLLAVKF